MITIIGNGPAGLIFERICQIKTWPHRIIGPSTYPSHNKLILLTPKNITFLKKLGFTIPQLKSYSQLRISSYLSKIPCYLPAQPEKQPLCYGIWLQDLLSVLSTYTNPCCEKITSGSLSPITLTTDHETLKTDYLIGCDGTSSISAKIANITYKQRPAYHCLTIPAHIEGDFIIQKHSQHLILAAIPDEQGSIIISSHHPFNKTLTLDELQNMIGPSLTIRSIQPPSYHRLKPRIATTNFKDKVLLMGNAAVTMEPVAAKGLNHIINSLKHIDALSDYALLDSAAINIHQLNHIEFNNMNKIVHPTKHQKLIHKFGFYSQLISPLFQESLLHFGNPND